jgi:hypothetical protein
MVLTEYFWNLPNIRNRNREEERSDNHASGPSHNDITMLKKKKSRLKRFRHKMPQFIRTALLENKVMEAYRNRPPYQQNDYLGWITRAKLEQTRQKRLAQMLRELAGGDRYMNMNYHPKQGLKTGPESRTT